ncbi:dihydroneopterin aldolase [Sphingomonas sp. ID1715]|uniref:dihydroneopterin aldolase n=1 Tax=Sphingomonas sp. ID1715 TaxID=1656898 RepID=UPI00148910B3|nr:dihydroneopterin aldolase [Sphingomonas sp. ID1715]NNM75814.1 dihydroneopterin aldolase [Sphingomonas sp. ID1715]
MTTPPRIEGLVPSELAPKSFRIFLNDFDLPVDIGFHDFEVGTPQRLLVSVEVWVTAEAFASEDSAAVAWNYDFLRTEIRRMTEGRRFNLQETLAREIYELIAARKGVTGLRVSTRKPDIYPDCAGVGVEISSF